MGAGGAMMSRHGRIAIGAAFLLAVVSMVIAHPLLARQSEPDIGPPALEAAIAQSHVALDAILNGDPSLYLALFADSEDITLGNPFGPFGEGRDAVAATLANAASKYQRGAARVERVALYADENSATLVEIEHDRAQLTGREDFSEFSVRVTSLYRRYGSGWRLVHRHADPITTMRSGATETVAMPGNQSELSERQAEVWQGEVDYWDRVNSRDLEGYLDLWHPDFTGWPCGAPGPADLSGLAEFAEGWFEGMTARGQRTVPTQEAVIVKDGFAITYLSADTQRLDADGRTATKREKFVHTWQATPDGWKIIGGMCAPLEAYDASVTAQADDDTILDLSPILDNRTRVIIEGIRSGDVSQIMALYGPGSLYAADNETLLSDPASIREFWVSVAASPAHDATLEVLRIERLGPGAFVEIQQYDVFDEAGARMFGGYASLLWRKMGGRWGIAADVSN